MSEQLSSASAFLQGKRVMLPTGLTGTVQAIHHGRGMQRVVTFKDGTTATTTQKGVAKMVSAVLNKQNADLAATSMRRHSSGRVYVTLGGPVKGVRKGYASERGAKQAIERHYGKTGN